MAHYIDKSALVAEIERLKQKNNESENVYDFGTEHALKSILSFLDTLEVKEKDLELTWEDIPKIFQISEELKISWWFRDNEQTKLIGKQPFWEEVLKRFKDKKE